jgi:hypothetical protein
MGWLSNLFGGGAKAAGEGVASAVGSVGQLAKDIRSAVTGDVDPEKAAEIEGKAMEIEAAARQAQAEINKAEAQHPSLFVAGARPAVLWVCVLALLYNFVVRPLAVGFGAVDMPEIDARALWPLMSGILGLGGMRSWEKGRGVNNRHG